MELLTKALEWPVSSLEGVAFLEVVIIGVLGWVAITLRRNAREARESRGRIYDYVRSELKEIRREIQEQGGRFVGMLRAHDEKCETRYGEDQRWKGRVEGKLGLDEE